MSFDLHDLQALSIGASESAVSYITEALSITEGEPVSNDQHMAVIVAMINTIAFLEVKLRKNLKNQEAWVSARATIDNLVEKISEKVLDSRPRGGIITG